MSFTFAALSNILSLMALLINTILLIYLLVCYVNTNKAHVINDKPRTIKRTTEKGSVNKGKFSLKNIPCYLSRVSIEGFKEVDYDLKDYLLIDKKKLQDNEFYVDYILGDIIFNSNNNGVNIVVDYYAFIPKEQIIIK